MVYKMNGSNYDDKGETGYCDRCGISKINFFFNRYNDGGKYCGACDRERKREAERNEIEAQRQAERNRLIAEQQESMRQMNIRRQQREQRETPRSLNQNERLTELERQVSNFTQQVKTLQEENQVLKTQIPQPINKVDKFTQSGNSTQSQDKGVQTEMFFEWKTLGEKIKKGQETSRLLLQIIEAKIEIYKK